MTEIFHWLIANLAEFMAIVTGLLYIFYSARNNAICWPFGIVSSGIYSYISYHAGIFAGMALYIYYVTAGFYGWINWTAKGTSSMLTIQKTSFCCGIILIIITLSLFFPTAWYLSNYTASNIPWSDAFITALSITATWMLAKRLLGNWLIWIVANTASVVIYWQKELYLSAGLFLVYTIMAVVGYFNWHRIWKQPKPL